MNKFFEPNANFKTLYQEDFLKNSEFYFTVTKWGILIHANQGQEHDRCMCIYKFVYNMNINTTYILLISGNSTECCNLPDGDGVMELQLSRHFLANVTALLVSVAVIVSPLRARVLVAWGSINAILTLCTIQILSTHNFVSDDPYFCIAMFRALLNNPTRRYGVAPTTATWNREREREGSSIGNTAARFLIALPAPRRC
jgi:hypothetical protein